MSKYRLEKYCKAQNGKISVLIGGVFALGLLCVLGVGTTSFFSTQDTFADEELQEYEELTLSLGQVITVTAANPKRVAVANPDIVDVQSVTANEVALAPKSVGITTLSVWDEYGQHAYRLKVFNEDLYQAKQQADNVIKELHLLGVEAKISDTQGKVLLTGEVADISEKERLLTVLENIKEKVLDVITIKEESALVQIDTQILEITHDNVKNLGITYPDSLALTDDAPKKMNKIGEMFATSMWTRAKLDVSLGLLVKEGKARILSQPKLVCLSGKEAEFLVGGEIPIIKSLISQTGTGYSVEYKEYGISLKIKPTVKEKVNIFLNISTKVSEIDEANAIGSKTAATYAPAFTTRNAQTELSLKDGQSVVIAGILKNKDSNTVKKFPFLGEVPVLGMLWRSRDFQNNQTELVILLTPTIVKNYMPAKDALPVKTTFSEESREIQPEAKKTSHPVDTQEDGVLNVYVEDVKNHITSSLRYPSLASELGSTGTVKVRVRILADGQLKDTLILDSSGSQLLDNSVIKTIRKLAPFPSFPSSVKRKEVVVDIPIVYS